jgi:hypothetical protein
MASTHAWVGGTSTAFTLAGNWDNAVAPATGDTLIYNSQSTGNNACIGGCDAGSAGHTYPKVMVGERYVQQLGANGDPLDPTAFTHFYWRSGYTGTSYIQGTIADGVIEAPTAGAGTIEFSGTSQRLAVNGGTVNYTAAATIDNNTLYFLDLNESRGVPTRVSIAAGCTIGAATVISVAGGELVLAQSAALLVVNGGTVHLRDAAAVTSLLLIGGNGVVNWDSTGTIAEAHVTSNGMLRSTEWTRPKTLTTGYMSGNGQMDLRGKGGMILTMTNGVICNGVHSPILPAGTVITGT